MKITSIKQQIKNPERASIFVDGKYSFSLSLNELVAEKLKINQDVDEPELKRLKKLSDDGKLKMRALEWVMSRPRSIREFKNYMYRKKADPDLTDKLILEFSEKNYLNESRFAEWLSDVRQRRGKSDRAIASELASKGIVREIVDEIIKGDSEHDRLKLLVDKKSKIPRYKADPQKLMQYLARQGFKYDDIKLILASKNDIT
ncbi:MAG: RecX family transcriptional regulator [bacterium]|nr:RecX family transcriptional regulator [bacterium]